MSDESKYCVDASAEKPTDSLESIVAESLWKPLEQVARHYQATASFEEFVKSRHGGLISVLKKAERFAVEEVGPRLDNEVRKAASNGGQTSNPMYPEPTVEHGTGDKLEGRE